MAVKVTCPSCGSWLKVATRKIGLKIVCPKCSTALVALGERKSHRVDGIPVERPSSSASHVNLVILYIILIALPGAWIPALRYRAMRNDEILAARANLASIESAKDEPQTDPRDDPPMVARVDGPAIDPPTKKMPAADDPKSDPLELPDTVGPRRPPPKVTPVLQPPPQPPEIAKIDPFPRPPRVVPPPPPFVPPPPPVKTAAELKVDGIFDEIRRFPAASKTQNQQLQILLNGPLPRYGDEIDEYAHDGFNPFGVASGDFERLKKEYPLRVISYEISQRLAKTKSLTIRETMTSPIDAKAKARIPSEQKEPALAILSLQEVLEEAQTAAAQRDNEKSKRWRAHFDLAMARLQARMIYLTEYDNLLAAVRSDSMPLLENGQKSWHAAPIAKVQTKETSVKDMAKQLAKSWERIARDYPNSPWSLVAEREKDVPLGLEWVATKK